jgi:Spy/CpxP family protein refolding chaperone
VAIISTRSRSNVNSAHRSRQFSAGRLLAAAALACAIGFASSSFSAEGEKFKPSIPDELGEAWDRLQQILQDWSGRMRERFGGRESTENRPAISQMLSYKDYLGLTPEQVKKLEQLRDNFQRQSIRNDADQRLVELDIVNLLDNPTLDVAKVEGKIREAEKLRADLRIARVKVIEQAKAVLTAEQRKKYLETVDSRAPRPPRASQNPPAKE